MDPLAEAYNFQSTYAYAANNPISNIDILGMAAASTQELIDNVWAQGNGTYDNDGNCTCGCPEKPPCDKNSTVAIDPGHGDHHLTNGQIDPGASGNGALEKDLALDISNSVNTALGQMGVNTIMTRTGDLKVNAGRLVWRIRAANGADIFVSIHLDAAANPKASGMTVLYKDGQAGSQALAESIANSQTVMSLRGTGSRKDIRGLHVLREFKGGASVLIEVGFISNARDKGLIQNRTNQIGGEIAAGIYKFINGSNSSPTSKLIPR